jgi:SAM-dependent methyltransferase
LLYLENPPEYASLKDELAWEKTYAAELAKRRRRNPVLYHLGRALKFVPERLFKRDKLVSWIRRYFAPGPVLDVGCAGGHTLNRLPPEFVPYGIELSEELCRLANERFSLRGGRALAGDALSVLPKFDAGFFAGIIMTAFLEHEPNPRSVLEATIRVMRPGARVIVKVPNYASWNRLTRGKNWCGFRFPEHVNYFAPAQLTRLFTESGYRVKRFGLLERFPTSDNMWMLAERN